MGRNQKKWIALTAVVLAVGALFFFWKKPGGSGSPHASVDPTSILPAPHTPDDIQEEGQAPDSNASSPHAQQGGSPSDSPETLSPESTTTAPAQPGSTAGVTTHGAGAVTPPAEPAQAGKKPEGTAALSHQSPGTSSGVTAVPGAPGTSPAPHAQMPGTPALPAAQPDGCFTLAFKHQDLPGHQNGEACTQHKNLLALPSQKLSAKSLCVRVNGTPVKFAFDSKKNHVLLSSIAGPRSEITVRYCTGGATCAEDCTVPRDEFMEALGAVDTNGSKPTVAWDIRNSGKGPTKEEAALDKELVELKRELASVERNSEEIFKGWVAGKEKAATCKASPGKVAKL